MKKYLTSLIGALCLLGSTIEAMEDHSAKEGAGIFLISKNEKGTPVTLFGLRDDAHYWCNLGGQANDGEESYVTAAREVTEESFGIYAIPAEFLKNSLCIINNQISDSKYGVTRYSMYIRYVPYVSEEVMNKLIQKKQNSKHVEYRKFLWLPIDLVSSSDSIKFNGKEIAIMPAVRDSIKIAKDKGIIQKIIDGKLEQSIEFDLDQFNKKIIDEFKPKDDAPVHADAVRSEDNKKRFSPSLRFLKIILGDEVTEESISNDEKLKGYIRNFWNLWKNSGKRETTGNIDVNEDELNTLVTILRHEQAEDAKGNRVFYHGLHGKLLFLYKYWGKLFSLIQGKHLDYVLRGDAMQFFDSNNELITFEKFLQKLKNEDDTYEIKHYGDDADKLCLFVNPMLFLGPGVSNSTSSALEYFLISHSVILRSLKDLLSQSFLLLGMDSKDADTCCNEVKSLFRCFYKYNGITTASPNNGGILAISIPQADIDKFTFALPQWDRGNLIKTSSLFTNVVEYKGTKKFKEALPKEQFDIMQLTKEARIYLDPSHPLDIKAFFHYPTQDETEFENQLNALAELHVSKMLGCKQIPNCLYNDKDTIFKYWEHQYKTQNKEAPELKNHTNNLFNIAFEHNLNNLVETLKSSQPLPEFNEIKPSLLKTIMSGNSNALKLFLEYYKKDIRGMDPKELITSTVALSMMQTSDALWKTNFHTFLKAVFDNELSPILREVIWGSLLYDIYSMEAFAKFDDRFSSVAGFFSKEYLSELFNKRVAEKSIFNKDELYSNYISSYAFIKAGLNLNPSTAEGNTNFNKLLSLKPKNLLSAQGGAYRRNRTYILAYYDLFDSQYFNDFAIDFCCDAHSNFAYTNQFSCTTDVRDSSIVVNVKNLLIDPGKQETKDFEILIGLDLLQLPLSMNGIPLYQRNAAPQKIVHLKNFKISISSDLLQLPHSMNGIPLDQGNAAIQKIAHLLETSPNFIKKFKEYLPTAIIGDLPGHTWAEKFKNVCSSPDVTWEKITNQIDELDEIGVLLCHLDDIYEVVKSHKNDTNFTEGMTEDQKRQFNELVLAFNFLSCNEFQLKPEILLSDFVKNLILKYIKDTKQRFNDSDICYNANVPLWIIMERGTWYTLSFKNPSEDFGAFLDRISASYSPSSERGMVSYNHQFFYNYLKPENLKFLTRENLLKTPADIRNYLYRNLCYSSNIDILMDSKILNEIYEWRNSKINFLAGLCNSENKNADLISFLQEKLRDGSIYPGITPFDIFKSVAEHLNIKSAKNLIKEIENKPEVPQTK